MMLTSTILLTLACLCRARMLPSEYNALQKIYEAANGQNWLWDTLFIGRSEWNFNSTTSDPCFNLWEGVRCESSELCPNETCRLYSLILPSFNLTGSIPSDIGAFSALTQLVLSDNSLGNTLPKEIGLLTNLNLLNISYCSFEGEIPESFGGLSNLQFLNLAHNNLIGSIPKNFDNLWQMEFFYIFDNYLTGPIPSFFGDFLELSYLNIGGNSLSSTIPTELNQCSSLQYLNVQNNYLTGTLPHMSLTSLQHLSCDSNVLEGHVFPCFGDLTNITFFRLDHNLLSGTIPPELSKLSNLQTLLMFKNRFVGPIDHLFSVEQTQLSVIDLSANALTGTVPATLFQLSSLSIISLVKNCFGGTIPAMCESNYLTIIAMDGLTSGDSCQSSLWDPLRIFSSYLANTVPGTIPDCLWTLPNITTISMSGNGLQGSLPQDMALPDSLLEVDLSYNRLSNEIPYDFQTHPFTSLDLSRNKLCGDITYMTEFPVAPENGSFLNLEVNRLTGDVPHNFVDADNVNILLGNAFSCKHQNDLPQSDPQHATFVCGSDELASSFEILGLMYGFGAFFIIVFGCHVQQVALLSPSNNAQIKRVTLALSSICQQLWRQQFAPTPTALGAVLLAPVGLPSLSIPHISHFMSLLISFRTLCTYLTMVAMLLCLPVYISFYYSDETYYSHKEQYGWLYSSAYLSGNIPAACLMAIFAIVCIYVVLQVISICGEMQESASSSFRDSDLNEVYFEDDCPSRHESRASDFSSESSSHSADFLPVRLSESFSMSSVNPMSLLGRSDKCAGGASPPISINRDSLSIMRNTIQEGSRQANTAIAYFLVFLLNGLLTFACNCCYVYVLYSGVSTELKYFVQFVMALFKLVWNTAFVRILINRLNPGRNRMQLHVLMLVFNNLVAPCMAIAVASASCFEEIFMGTKTAYSSYSFQYCQEASQSPDPDGQLVTHCTFYNDLNVGTEFSPPFIYSFQCGPTLIIAYVPVFVYSYACLAVFTPMFYVLVANVSMKSLSAIMPPSLIAKIDGVLRPQDNSSQKFEYLMHAHSLIARYVVHLVVLLTFGLTCPPLAIVILLAVCSSTLTWQIVVSRFLTYDSTSDGYNKLSVTDDDVSNTSTQLLASVSGRLYELESSISGAWVNLRASNWLILVCAMFFFMFQLFDMAGNTSDGISAIWVPISVGIFLVLSRLLFFQKAAL